MSKVIIRIGVFLAGLIGVGCLVDAVAERTAERVVDKLSSVDSNIPADPDDEMLEPDDIT